MIDVEAELLHAVMRDNATYWRVCDVVAESDFIDGKARRLWSIMAMRAKDQSAFDPVTLIDEYPAAADYVLDVSTQTVGSPTAARGYAEIIAARALQRRVTEAGRKIAELRGNDVFNDAMKILSEARGKDRASVHALKHHMRDWFGDVTRRADTTQKLTGVPTSLPWLDTLTGGLQPGDVVFIAARPSVGKTALALQIALHAASQSTPVYFASLEMSGKQLADRAVSHLGRTSTSAIRCPSSLTDEDWAGVSRGIELGSELGVWIDDVSTATAEDIAARCRQSREEHGIGLAIVDYLGLLKLPKAERKDIALGDAAKALKVLAKDLSIPVIVLCQLNRTADQIRPRLSALKDSGDIEAHADVVLFLHRPDDEDRESVELIAAKNRNGETGSQWLSYNGAHLRFAESEGPARQSVVPMARRGGFRARAGRDLASGS